MVVTAFRSLRRARNASKREGPSKQARHLRRKSSDKRRLKDAQSFGEFAERWFEEAPMADSTRTMRRSIYTRDLEQTWRRRLLSEITPNDLRALCQRIKDRGAPATAVHVRDITKQIFSFAILHGEKVLNPADEVGPASIATFVPKDRSLSAGEPAQSAS